MIGKFVYTVANGEAPPNRSGICVNDALIELLSSQKRSITEHYENRKWDKHKKQANLYELIFTTTHPSLAKFSPLSRSFFKHWEILHDFKDELSDLHDLSKPLVCAFLAEGPGGFIEAFTRLRPNGIDRLYGVTLISNQKSIPSWKISKDMCAKHNIELLYGPEGNGSLYSLENIENFAQVIGAHACDYVTADGGFDFSSDFDLQENTSSFLIMCEIFTAMMLLKPGGSFLLKIFDITLPVTKTAIFILYQHFDCLTFVKPLTSRPANSEKYILARGFRGSSSSSSSSSKYMSLLEKTIRKGYHQKSLDELVAQIKPTREFLESIALYNVFYTIKQITHINLSLSYIYSNHDDEDTLPSQIEHAIRWCDHYHIPINLTHLHSYKRLISGADKKPMSLGDQGS